MTTHEFDYSAYSDPTPEMIEAGIKVLYASGMPNAAGECDLSRDRPLVAAIFKAMMEARPQAQR